MFCSKTVREEVVWVIWNMLFLTFLNIDDVDVTFRGIRGSMTVFDFNSTSKKHIKHATRAMDVRYSSPSTKNWEPIVFSLYSKHF